MFHSKPTKTKLITSLSATAGLFIMAGPANAATLINTYGPSNITATASSSLNGFHNPVETINGNGLNQTTGEHGTSNRTYWRTTIVEDTTSSDVWIQWDLGASYVLDSVQVWNHNETSRFINGINQLDIYVASALSDPGSDPEAGSFTADWTQIGTDVLFAQAPGSTSYTGFDLESGTTGGAVTLPAGAIRYVRFEVDSAHSGTEVGMAEIQFFEVIPEPSTALLGGIGLLALLRRRRA